MEPSILMRTAPIAFVILALAACARADYAYLDQVGARGPTSYAAALSGATTPQAYGALCDGVTNDRAAIQAALNSGAAEVDVTGTCLAGRAGSAAWCLSLPASVTLRGPGTLLQAGGLPVASVRLLEADGPGASIVGITLDGNFANQTTADEHRAGLFATAGITIDDVVFQNFSGDGLSLAGGSGYVLRNVRAVNNHRDGISCVRVVDNVLVEASTFVGNSAQQVDLEPAMCSHVMLRDSVLDGAGVSSDYVLAIAKGDHFRAIANVINGPVDVVHSHDVVFLDNVFANATMSSNILVYQDSDAVVIDNQLTATAAHSVIQVTGIAFPGAQPSATLLSNTITGPGAAALVYAQGAAEVTLGTGAATGNTFSCTASPSTAFVPRASLPANPFSRAELRGNTVAGCSRAVMASGIGGGAAIGQIIAGGNALGAALVSLDDGGTGALQSYLGDLTVSRWPVGAVFTPAGPAGTLMEAVP
jgi:hypothetical protein